MELATKTEYGKPEKVIVKWAENLTSFKFVEKYF